METVLMVQWVGVRPFHSLGFICSRRTS